MYVVYNIVDTFIFYTIYTVILLTPVFIAERIQQFK